MLRIVLYAQAFYYVVTGLWPVFHLRSFEIVTGHKTDDWLVQMVGLLAAAIGLALFTGARTSPVPGAIVLLALASEASFAAIDIVYASAGRISPIYLADAAVELLLALGVTVGWRRRSR
jgi:hypothetical protein